MALRHVLLRFMDRVAVAEVLLENAAARGPLQPAFIQCTLQCEASDLVTYYQCSTPCKHKTLRVAYAPPNQTDPHERAIVLALKAERERQGISANQLAAQIGVSRAAITHIEADRSRPTLWLLIKIADGLGMEFPLPVKSKARR